MAPRITRPRCLVYLLDKYFEKFPAKAAQLDVFYLPPRAQFTPDSVWYDCAPVGINKLKKFMESMCSDAGIPGKKTNNSLRETGATALFNAGVPERVIRDVTGHRSNALLTYQRPTLEQKQEAPSILVQGKKKFDPGKENLHHSLQRNRLHQIMELLVCLALSILVSLICHSESVFKQQ